MDAFVVILTIHLWVVAIYRIWRLERDIGELKTKIDRNERLLREREEKGE